MLGPALKDKIDSPGIHKGLGSIFKTWQIQTDQDLSSSEPTLIPVLKIFLINFFHFDIVKKPCSIKMHNWMTLV